VSDFDSFLSDILATVLGGALLTLIFFLLREKVFNHSDIDGSWTFTQHTLKTAYHPYEEMKLTYLVLLWREGDNVYGTAEKDYEDSNQHQGYFVGKSRSNITLQGYIQKNIFSPNRITIHMIENGTTRESSTVHKLRIESTNKMSGRFASTIANQEGNVVWERKSS